MHDNEIEKLVGDATAYGTVFTARRRRRAAGRLATLRTTAAIRGMAQALAAGRDQGVVAIAQQALTGLAEQDAVDAVCEVLIDTGDQRLAALVASAGYEHSEPARRALVLFLAGEFDRYAELDAGGSLLRAVHAEADGPLRARLADRARESARVEWVDMLAMDGTAGRVRTVSDPEWAAVIDILAAAGRWDELWRLVSQAPPVWGVRMVHALSAGGWRPENDAEHRRLDELAALAQECSADPVSNLIVTDPVVLTAHRAWATALAVEPDGPLLVSGDYDGTVRLWHLPTGTPAGELAVGRYLWCLAITPDGRLLASGEHRGAARLWHLPAGESGDTVTSPEFRVGCLAVSPDGRLLVAGATDGTVRLWRLPSGEPAGVLTGHVGGVWCLAMTPDGRLLASGDDHRTVRLWKLPSGEPAGVLSSHYGMVTALAVTPDGKLLASADSGAAVRLWTLPSGELSGVALAHNTLWSLAVTPDGRLLAGGEDRGSVRLWHLPSGRAAGVLNGHRRAVRRLAMTPHQLASAGSDGTVRLWPMALISASRTPVADVDLAAVERILDTASDGPTRAWALMITALAQR
ncbi:hypothetical protein Pth03_74210 [Planotetraspora thailandica]|uniref:Anaphase-promoting complex subunit 4 WD40 domain-containing protein n=1 Tax=Planotetraspora thailandica TaxID=487172 RepID=A0A8J3Y1A3_9ACTN|nr:WD40 repeat domain-containing protein [Planotetraspora thailandica]GII59032.1 hypothetical protein Pth03_74210 [Planotetraspora thailandica]